jgi:predicted DNA-binding transcriptional regulator YafY
MLNGGKATQNKPGWYYKDKKAQKKTAQKSDNKANLAQTILPLVRSAIDNNNNLKIKYYTHYRGAWSVREVTPYRVYLQDDAFYMEAFCHSRQENRIFRLDGIESAETLTRKTTNQVAATSSYRPANEPPAQTYKAQSNNYSVEWSNVVAVILLIGLIYLLVR